MNMVKNALVIAVVALTMPLTAVAAEHKMEDMDHQAGKDHGKMDMKDMDHGEMKHDSMKGMDHGGMKMDDNTFMLGEQSVEGVKAMAHLKDVQAAMAKMGMKETHHFAVMLADAKKGETIESGTVALKVVSPSGKEGSAVKLMGMQGHFGADIALAEKGEYYFKVGTMLSDGQKRQFEFEYTVK